MNPESRRSMQIAQAMTVGIRRSGDDVHAFSMARYSHPEHDVAVFYGLMRPILDAYRKCGRKAVYIDLGYWGRHEGGRREGFHKFAVNSRHPTVYFQKVSHDSERFKHHNIDIKPWRHGAGRYIILAGMSAKAANAEGFKPEEWERNMVTEIRRYTDREIVYRPKPNWKQARPIDGTRFVRGEDGDIDRYLRDCHAVVTHHSNVAIDSILHGTPVFVWDGIAAIAGKGSNDISKIENPPEATEREQWAWDAAWTQWNLTEMRAGLAWQYLKREALGL